MDSLTQIALGACSAAALVPPGQRRKAAGIGAFLGTLPDLDVFLNYGGPVVRNRSLAGSAPLVDAGPGTPPSLVRRHSDRPAHPSSARCPHRLRYAALLALHPTAGRLGDSFYHRSSLHPSPHRRPDRCSHFSRFPNLGPMVDDGLDPEHFVSRLVLGGANSCGG
jgi:hypothetical protein